MSAGVLRVQLPSARGSGACVTVKNVAGSSVKVLAVPGETIDDGGSVNLLAGVCYSFLDAEPGAWLIVGGFNVSYIPATGDLNVTQITATYFVISTDQYIEVTATAAMAVSLPAAVGSGRPLTIKKVDGTNAKITLAPNGTDTIDGATSYIIKQQYVSISLIDAAAGKWEII